MTVLCGEKNVKLFSLSLFDVWFFSPPLTLHLGFDMFGWLPGWEEKYFGERKR